MTRAFPLLLLALAACGDAARPAVSAEAPVPAFSHAPFNVTDPAPPPPPRLPVAGKAGAPADTAPAFRSSADCQMLDRGEWTAHINAMPGPNGGPRLIVTGALRVKPAARTELSLDPAVLESNPPQLIVNLAVRLPSEPTIDSAERRQVRGEWPVTPPIGAVHIRCGGRTIASIRQVEIAY
jgi:hypothetical protein